MKYKVGDRVHHAAYGDGTVIGHYGRGETAPAAVEFDIPQRDFHEAYTYGGKPGKTNHCWYVAESELTPVNNPSWVLIVRPDKSDPDTTTAILKVDGKETRRESVKRHHKDTYDMQTAIKAVMAKIEPPKSEPIMIGNRELKVGSKFILKPYNAIYAGGIESCNWNNMMRRVITVKNIIRGETYMVTVIPIASPWDIPVTAIDRILED
jgi:hypothetical protein